jgi:Mn-dependent DtxR family transcriptional regulator
MQVSAGAVAAVLGRLQAAGLVAHNRDGSLVADLTARGLGHAGTFRSRMAWMPHSSPFVFQVNECVYV